MSEVASSSDPAHPQAPSLNSTPLIVPADPPKSRTLPALLALSAALLLMATLILPSFALRAADYAWGSARASDGAHLTLGWRKGTTYGIKPVEFETDRGTSLVWSKSDGGESDLWKSTPGWEGVFRAGGNVGVLVILALSSPLFLFVCVPYAWRRAMRGAAGWTDGCGATVCIATQAIWLAFGVAVLVATGLFVNKADRAVRLSSRKGIDVVCAGEVVCSGIATPEECAQCEFEPSGVVCPGSDGCSLVLIEVEDGVEMEFEVGKAVWLLVVEGVLLIGLAAGFLCVYVWLVRKRPGSKEGSTSTTALESDAL